jgi:hypothetical protein
MQSQFNKKASPYNYVIGQMVWSDVRNFLGRNRKLSPNWEGPFPISQVYENGVVEIIYKNKKNCQLGSSLTLSQSLCKLEMLFCRQFQSLISRQIIKICIRICFSSACPARLSGLLLWICSPYPLLLLVFHRQILIPLFK